MLQFAELVQYPGIPAFHLAVEDGVPLPNADFQRGVSFVLQQHQQGKKVLIACGAGISRSVIFAIAVLHETEGTALLTAYQETVNAHVAAATPGTLEILMRVLPGGRSVHTSTEALYPCR